MPKDILYNAVAKLGDGDTPTPYSLTDYIWPPLPIEGYELIGRTNSCTRRSGDSVETAGKYIHRFLQPLRDYRNYFSIFPDACKVLYVVRDVVHYLVALTCDFSLGLCLGALLQSKPLYLSATVILSCGIPAVNALINIVSFIQYPAELVSPLDTELGYPCYVPSAEGWIEKTIMTAVLALLGVVTVVIRYRGQGGRLFRVISWDGGVHYLSLLAIRMTVAILWTPTVLSMLELERNPVYLLADVANRVVIPILAQRLLINMRKIDYMGSVPVASKLLFAHSASVSEGDTESYLNSLVVAQMPPGYPNQGATRQTTGSSKG
ncbi:hypothetical protein FA13DRAFT_1793780 [Coprinellus micaceus]|uniref:Uncharacterized protein n=1 Tax=Coprinellus micaceus TaxID=71717 RepID=A0A4Y7T4W2_COPMI|nr:hypothetical protein FA13DRAFT_1793780 [Coprinellus micaceus]